MKSATLMELKMWLLNFGLISIICLETVLGSREFVIEPGTAQWENAMTACDSKGKIMVPGRRFRGKTLANAMADGTKVWLHGWRTVSDITPDASNKLRTLKVDFAKPRKNPCALVCRKDLSFFVAPTTAGSVVAGRSICESDGGSLVNITTEDDAIGVIDVMAPDVSHWANSISSDSSKIKQCLYAQKMGSDVKYEYDDCKSEYQYICISGKDFSPLISLKIARFAEFEAVIDEYTASLLSLSSTSVTMETSSSIVMSSLSSMLSEDMSESSSQTVVSPSAVVIDSMQSTSESRQTSAAIESSTSVQEQSTTLSSSTEMSSSVTVTSKYMPPDSDRASHLFAGVLIKNKTVSSSYIMTSFSSSIMTSVSSSSKIMVVHPDFGMSTSSVVQTTLDEDSSHTQDEFKSVMMPSFDDSIVTPPLIKSEPVASETTSVHVEDGGFITPSPSLTSSETKMYNTMYPDLPSMEKQTTVAFKKSEISNTSGVPTVLEYDDTDQEPVADSHVSPTAESSTQMSSSKSSMASDEFKKLTIITTSRVPIVDNESSQQVNGTFSSKDKSYTRMSSSISPTTVFIMSMSSEKASKTSPPSDSKSLVLSQTEQKTVIGTPISSSTAYISDSYVDVVTPLIAVTKSSSTSDWRQSSSSIYVESKPVDPLINLVPSTSSTRPEEATDIDYMTSDFDDIQPTSTEEYPYYVITPFFTKASDYDTFPSEYPTFTSSSVTTHRPDETDSSIEDDLDVDDYEEENISADKAKKNAPKSEEGIEVGVWVAFGILIVLVIISLVLAFFLYRRRKLQKSKSITPSNGAANTGAAGETVELRDSRSPSRENGKGNDAQGV